MSGFFAVFGHQAIYAKRMLMLGFEDSDDVTI